MALKKGLHGMKTDAEGTELHIVDEYDQGELGLIADG